MFACIEDRIWRPIPSRLRGRPKLVASEVHPLFSRILQVHGLSEERRILPEDVLPAHKSIPHDPPDLRHKHEVYRTVRYPVRPLPTVILNPLDLHIGTRTADDEDENEDEDGPSAQRPTPKACLNTRTPEHHSPYPFVPESTMLLMK